MKKTAARIALEKNLYEHFRRICQHCGHILALHRIGDDKCPVVSKGGYSVDYDETVTHFKEKPAPDENGGGPR